MRGWHEPGWYQVLLAASVAGTLLLTRIFLASVARTLQQEKIVFGRV